MEKLPSGLVLVNKPIGITSAHCLNRIKKRLPKGTKVGHAGTLDTFASGLLVVGVGRPATKQLSTIMQMDKWYEFTAQLGVETDTLDRTGTVIKRQEEVPQVSEAELIRVLASFKPSYQQTPPLYCALKHQGTRLSDLVRKKKLSAQELEALVATKTREVNIYSLQLKSINFPLFTCEARVSHGTYIRSLVRDIGHQLGSCATTEQLCRTAIGGFTLATAGALDQFIANSLS